MWTEGVRATQRGKVLLKGGRRQPSIPGSHIDTVREITVVATVMVSDDVGYGALQHAMTILSANAVVRCNMTWYTDVDAVCAAVVYLDVV